MTGNANPFDPRVIAALIIAGIVGFIGFWVVSTFAPELSSGRNGGGHALSRSATGFAGVVELARAAGLDPEIVRDPRLGVSAARRSELGGLLVLTPTAQARLEDIDERLRDIENQVLVVLPKYAPLADPSGRDKVRGAVPLPNGAVVLGARGADPFGLLDEAAGGGDAAGETGIKSPGKILPAYFTRSVTPKTRTVTTDPWGGGAITIHLPRQLQLLTDQNVEPIISVEGGILFGRVDLGPNSRDIYVLSDPDVINNLALDDDARAVGAIRLLETIAGEGEPVGFDVAMNGLGRDQHSLLRIAFTPPFLALTLCLLAAGLLALWQGFVRFGPAWREDRSIQLGKGALVATNAQLIVQARRTRSFAVRYANMVREVAARRLHAPTRLAGGALDTWLDRFVDSRGQRFSQLVQQLEEARTSDETVARARALGLWRREIVRDGK